MRRSTKKIAIFFVALCMALGVFGGGMLVHTLGANGLGSSIASGNLGGSGLGGSGLGSSGQTPLIAPMATGLTLKFTMPKVYSDPTPVLIVNSPIAGTITYGGGISSSATTAVVGENIIELDRLSDGSYSGCTITVTAANNATSTLKLPTIKVKKAQDSQLFPHLRTAGYDYFYGMSDAEIEFLATHHDMIIGGEIRNAATYNKFIRANPDVKIMGYISMQVNVEEWLEQWAVKKGIDPEELFLHYEEDTTITLFAGKGTKTFPGYGPTGSATTLREARMRGNQGTYSTYCPTQERYVEAWLDYTLELLTIDAAAGAYRDGLFMDGFPGVLEEGIHLKNTIEFRQAGVTTFEEASEYAGNALVDMRNKMEQYCSAAAGKEIYIMGNASETRWVFDKP